MQIIVVVDRAAWWRDAEVVKAGVNHDFPQEYYDQILVAVGGRDLEFSASTVAEAKRLRTKLIGKQKLLRQIKREINVDMKRIRAEYRERSASAGSTSSTVLALFGQRGAAGHGQMQSGSWPGSVNRPWSPTISSSS